MSNLKPDELDHTLTDEVVCPHCGNEESDSWERRMGDGECDYDKCGECGGGFSVECTVTIKYTTEAK